MNKSQNIQPSLRMAIRKKIKKLIVENVDVGKRVFTSRPNPIVLNEIPCCLIYFSDDEASLYEKPRAYQRVLNVVINFLCRFPDTEYTEDWLDSREFETIRTLQNNENKLLGFDFIEECFVDGTQPSIIEDSGDQFIASNKIVYTVKYRDDLGASTTILNNFLRLYGEWELSLDQNVKKAKDLVNIQN